MKLEEKLQWTIDSASLFAPELILFGGIIFLIVSGLFIRKDGFTFFKLSSLLIVLLSGVVTLVDWPNVSVMLASGMIRLDSFSAYLKILFSLGAILSIIMTGRENIKSHVSEFYALLITIVAGANLLVMSMNLVMVLLSLELISISSYILAGYHFDKKGSEGSLKYFLFGSTATAIMIYGMSLIFGLSGTLDFSSSQFVTSLMEVNSPLLLVASLMIIGGILFKIAVPPFHIWAPDVYESAPIPVIAFFSVVPKLAGFGILIKLILAFNLYGQSHYDWQLIIAALAIIAITFGNFSALWQKDAKRMMAYSSIAQSGFMLIGLATLTDTGIQFFFFYGSIFLIMNFLTFQIISQFERYLSTTKIEDFAGVGKTMVWPSVMIIVGLVSLTGLPPTAGFTAKLFIFSSLWGAYAESQKSILLALFAFGLLNTVVSLFFYLKIPYYLFFKSAPAGVVSQNKSRGIENLFGIFLVVIILLLFLQPGLLMSWINRINFVF